MQDEDRQTTVPENAPTEEQAVTLRVVGVARGAPGLMGAGIIIVDREDVVREQVSRYLGVGSALEAQLQALALALRYARPYAPAKLKLVLANDTIVRQVGGLQPARHPAVLQALEELDLLLSGFSGATYHLGAHDDLAEAERLANLGVDARLNPFPTYNLPLPR